jgi:glucose/arabinose dehydrogenase
MVVVAALVSTLALEEAGAQTCGDPDRNGLDVIDAANVLRAAVALPSTCTMAPSLCDLDASGTIDVVDAANTQRAVVGLPAADACIPPLQLVEVARGFERPLFVTGAAGDLVRLYVVEQQGVVRLVKNGAVQAAAFLDIQDLVTPGGPGEQGFLGLALHPDYASNGRFFVHYTDVDGDTVVAEYARALGNADAAAPQAIRVLLTVEQPFANHNGGSIAFGADGLLYIGLGDGGSGGDPMNNAQNTMSKLGKILRIDVDRYPSPPPGNLPGADPDVWDLGLRNPFRFSFDRETGDLYIGDVGQQLFEEIDFEPAGSGQRNYGWRVLEGLHCFNPSVGCSAAGTTLPVAEYSHDVGCSVIGGYVYRGSAIPRLRGRYLYSDFCTPRVWSFVIVGGVATSPVELTTELGSDVIDNVTSFGEDGAGELYLVDQAGPIFRITPQ